ncbi:MAG: hypothetical protein SNJ69_05960 [Chloroflexaceae bacterium]
MTTARSLRQPPQGQLPHLVAGDMALEVGWAAAMRALLLLSEASAVCDPVLARLTDEEFALLRASIVRLNAIELISAA